MSKRKTSVGLINVATDRNSKVFGFIDFGVGHVICFPFRLNITNRKV